MKHYSTFIFDSYTHEPQTGTVVLRYSLDHALQFTETLHIPKGHIPQGADQAVDAALRNLFLAGGISYYKTYVPTSIEIRPFLLSEEEASFWNTVYEKGLGEFFYQNNIDFRGRIAFPFSDKKTTVVQDSPHQKSPSAIVPIGGGKDSIVTIEKLRKEGTDITLLRMGAHPLIDQIIQKMDLPCITVERRMDPLLFTVNQQDALNGHIPISAYLSCLSVVLAELHGHTDIVMSNEQSANFGNVEYCGTEINHQWSKSEEFEHLFQRHIHRTVNPNMHYYSALRSLDEMHIVKEFIQYPQYFDCFTSCNNNWKILQKEDSAERWCGACPKCAFVFLLLAAHLPKETVLQIFEGKNLLEHRELQSLFRQLLGKEGIKPFECVGTPEETTQALTMIRKRGEFHDSALLHIL